MILFAFPLRKEFYHGPKNRTTRLFNHCCHRYAYRFCYPGTRKQLFPSILPGHYGAAQQIVVRETAVRMSRALAVPVLGTPEYWLALDVGYTGDHAAWGETSLMMHLYPDTVDLSRLGKPPYQGVGGRDPKQSSAKDGKLLTEERFEDIKAATQKL